MYLKELEIQGFKSFGKKTKFSFNTPITSIVGPNGSGKSNVAEALRWVLGEQSLKSLRGKRGEDLIFNGSKSAARQNKASVTIVFNNSEKHFDVDFDEVSVTREVHRDGTNQYQINGSQVRLKDVYELLSQVSLGATSHHIISQGEADRILNASIKEKRSMIEDALGLKIYQYKKAESERKLDRTEQNIKEVKSLRRELAPHIKFLKKQVEQIEKAVEIKEELKERYKEYLKTEKSYLENLSKDQGENRSNLEDELNKVKTALEEAESKIEKEDQGESEKNSEIRSVDTEIMRVRSEKDELSRKLGRLEGQLLSMSSSDFIEKEDDGTKTCRYCGQEIKKDSEGHTQERVLHEEKINSIKQEKEDTEAKLAELKGLEMSLISKLNDLKQALDEGTLDARRAERALFDIKTSRNEILSRIEKLNMAEETKRHREADFKKEMGEAGILVGREALAIEGSVEVPENVESVQNERLRSIERLKIKLEDLGGGGDDVMKEYDATMQRDAHLEREIEDLEKSAESLKELMGELGDTLEKKFKAGIDKINKEFTKFFSLLFGGGDAGLSVVVDTRRKRADALLGEEHEEEEWGVDISVNLPRKKIRGLEMLSGGERALTSIALLFAMSQVNPPPFMVLDETDAALDEANSRKYADMVEALSENSQLILITHNRESMSRAQVLYGVTMSADSISTTLSIKFDEATNYAK